MKICHHIQHLNANKNLKIKFLLPSKGLVLEQVRRLQLLCVRIEIEANRVVVEK